MAEIDWALLCDYAFQDAGRKTCLIGVFDRIYTPRVPTIHRQAFLAMKVLGEVGEKAAIRVEIARPNGPPIADFGAEVVLADNGSAELQLGVAGVVLPDFGPYSFNIHINSQLVRAVTFLVTEPPKPPTIQ